MAKSTLMFWAIFGLAVILPKVVLVVTVAVLTMQTVLILVRLGDRAQRPRGGMSVPYSRFM